MLSITCVDTRAQRSARRIEQLYSTDAQFAAARPSTAVGIAISKSGLGLPQIIQTVMDGYPQRPALGQRATRVVTDPNTGRSSAQLLAEFETITYRELWNRTNALTNAFAAEALADRGQRVCVLGFASIDYATIDLALMLLGAVSVPLPTNAARAQLCHIVSETQPSLIASSTENLPDAISLVLSHRAPHRVVVFDYRPELDAHREALEAARARLAAIPVTVETLTAIIARGRTVRPAEADCGAQSADAPALLIYTSGSTGAPKGVVYTRNRVADFWRTSKAEVEATEQRTAPSITLNFMPMSHANGRQVLYGTLSNGGTAYFTARSDLSTLFDDLALVRPTELGFPPRIWDMLLERFGREVDRRLRDGTAEGADPGALKARVAADLRQVLLGGRYALAMMGSAPISEQMKASVESLLDLDVMEGYGSTEAGTVIINNEVQRPQVIDYKLVDVAELGYFLTDRPYPRGELLVKTRTLFSGYYRDPEDGAQVFDPDGFYRTGDIMAQVGPDRLAYLDRRNNVLKLSQGEFVAVSRLEAIFANSPLVRQIFVYANGARAYPLAVVVPTQDAQSRHGRAELKAELHTSLHRVAMSAGLAPYEIPRDFIVETTPFTPQNGLLTAIHKLARPHLTQRYGARLELLYTELADSQTRRLHRLRQTGGRLPALETIRRAAGALLGTETTEPRPEAHFKDLGGDSVSAVTFSNLLHDIYGFDVPVGVILGPATDLRALASHVESRRGAGWSGPSFASVHAPRATSVHAGDLKLAKFLDTKTLAAATSLPAADARARTVLLTGATGFLGRYLVLEWLRRLRAVGGKLICLVRAASDEQARVRLDTAFDSGDPQLPEHFRQLAVDRLEVLAGDKSEPGLGLDGPTWQRLADTVDLIVDPATLVNHVLSYRQLFAPNVAGTAELLRLALTTKRKPYAYVSTVSVANQIEPSAFTEDADIREISRTRTIDDSYANGYTTSKWASEVLLREAHDLCGLPVTVFRCDMILADTSYAGQLNLADTFTRLMLSVAATGIAPASFYRLGPDGKRQPAHFDGLPVEFIAEAVATLGARRHDGFQVHHVANPHHDGVGLDEYVDWLVDAGCPIRRIPDYDEWLSRFETALHALPDRKRRHSLLPLLQNYREPAEPIRGGIAPAPRFRGAVRQAKIGRDNDIPHVGPAIIAKYASDLQLLGLA
ncbi:fatty-acid--CoA ligase FadD9 [Mycobacterium marinum]|nr:carboxylic acid reductase [Mycobacterium marinum]GJO16556.1 fatty-acid--CoA ligase FadD9 [Mycobacterium marinum]